MSFYTQIISQSIDTLRSLEGLEPQITAAVDLIRGGLTQGHKLLICGNGGSAADASHLTTEFVVRFLDDRKPYPAICLNDSGSTLTAAGNDYGFDHVFARQVQALGQPGDVLVVFTTSGQSPNVLHALQAAQSQGLHSIAFLGRDGGAAKGLATVALIVPSQNTARIQEAHHLLIHVMCQWVERALDETPRPDRFQADPSPAV